MYGKMACRPPMRIKDLPPLEPDSEDELKTPAKSTNFNLDDKKDATDMFGNIHIPRRVSELSPLEPDSDDEENKNDRLNCAILNDSFLLSPTRSVDCETPIGKRSQIEKLKFLPVNRDLSNNNNKTNEKDDSFLKDLKKLYIDEKENSRTTQSAIIPKSRQVLFPIASATIIDNELLKADFLPLSRTKRAQFQETEKNTSVAETPHDQRKSPVGFSRNNQSSSQCRFRKANDRGKSLPDALINSAVSSEATTEGAIKKSTSLPDKHDLGAIATKIATTPLQSSEINFITPQVKSYQMPVSRRPNLLSSNITQKSRSAIDSEFRSPKILYRTPMALSRPPVSTLANSSINFALDDTVKEKSTPIKNDSSLMSVPEITAKRSSEDLFRDVMQSSGTTQAKNSDEKMVRINGNEYVIQKKLGSGGSSSVFLAHRKNNKKNVALKIVDLHGDKSIVEGYLNETKLLAKLQGDINVVSLYEYEHIPSEFTLYMVMEKGDSDLNKILQSYKTDLPLYVLMNFWYQMLQSVNYIHKNGVIHSDLKPANFLMVNGRLKLIDFGIASNIAIDSTSIIKFSQAGTFNYISPESLTDTSTGNSPAGKSQPKIKISTKSDVWSLGCILYLLLYKKTPFGHIKNVYAKVNAISNPNTEIDYPELSPYYPKILIEMTKKCLQHNPKKRSAVADLLNYPFHMIIPVNSKQFAPEVR